MQIKHIFLAVLVAAVWGCNFIFVKIGVHEVPPLFLCAMRFFFASIPAVFFFRVPSSQLKTIALFGLIMFGLQFALVFTSFTVGMTAGMASLMMQTQVFFSILFASLFLQERLSYWQIIGGLIACIGIVIAARHLDSNMTLPGVLLILSAAVTWGIGNLLIKKIHDENKNASIVWGSLIACLPLFLLSFFIEGSDKIFYSLQHFSFLAFISLAYIVYVSTWLGYGIWNWLLSKYPVSMVVPFTLLIPIFGMLSSVLVLNESLDSWKIAAAIFVITGLCVNLIGPRLSRKRYSLRQHVKHDPMKLKKTLIPSENLK